MCKEAVKPTTRNLKCNGFSDSRQTQPAIVDNYSYHIGVLLVAGLVGIVRRYH